MSGPPEGIPLSCRAWYEQGRNDFIAAVERGEADGWLCQFAPGFVEEAVRAEREGTLGALTLAGYLAPSELPGIRRMLEDRARSLAAVREASDG